MKKLYLLLIVLGIAWYASANPVNRQQARQQAEKFLQGKGIVISGETAARSIGHKSTANQPFYVFNTTDSRGFVIVAGDDRIEPIIGYTTQGSFDENNLPVNFKAWLEQAAAEIEAIAAQPTLARTESAPKNVSRKVAIHRAIDPLIITAWNQGNTDNVYNAHLPLVNGQIPCTGCVATAGAQVMYYYHRDLPDITQPIPGYKLTDGDGNDYSNGADTSNDLPAIQFQWNKMKTSYNYREPDAPTTEEEDAVADLMLYCGYAAHMNYGLADVHGGSSASTSTLADGFGKYFGFNPNTWKMVTRSYYSISEWDEIIYNELASGRPIIYSGSFRGGHAFICDGYDGAGLYHFNWGWGGGYNGFFKLQTTNPNGESNIKDMGYIADNYCIIGLQPMSWPDIIDPNADDTWEVPEIEGIVATASNISVENTTVSMRLSNGNEETYGFGFGIGELNGDGTITPIDIGKESYKNTDLQEGWGFSGISFDFSTYDLTDGSHTLVPISIVNGETDWRRCKPANLYFDVNVSGGEKTVIAHPIENLQINTFELATGGTPGYYQGVRLNITNNGDNLEKRLYVYVGTAADKGKSAGSETVKIAAGNTKDYRINISKLDAGNYTLRLLNKYDGDMVLAQTEITISQDLQVISFDFDTSQQRFTNSTIKVSATVENHAGDYAVPLYLLAGTGGTKEFKYAAGSAIESGSSEDVTFYFSPDQAGTWTLYIATDKEGENVIGETTIEIVDPPSGTVELTKIEEKVTCKGTSATYTLTVKNTGSTVNYQNLWALLFEDINGTNDWSYVQDKNIPLVLEPGETKTVSTTFDNLVVGRNYFANIRYETIYGSGNWKTFCFPEFTFTPSSNPSEPLLGDANGDGEVNAQDVVDIINHMMGKPTSTGTFDEEAADVNEDGTINVADIIMIITP